MAIPLCLARRHRAGDAIGKPPIRSVIAASRMKMPGATRLETGASFRTQHGCSNSLNLRALPCKNRWRVFWQKR